MSLSHDTEPSPARRKPVAPAKPVAGRCLCGAVEFEIDYPARWAWHDHSSASRHAHGAAYATYVGSWRKRFRFTKGAAVVTPLEEKAAKNARSLFARRGAPPVFQGARPPPN